MQSLCIWAVTFVVIDRAGTSQGTSNHRNEDTRVGSWGPKRPLDRILDVFQYVRIGLPLEGYRMMRRKLSYQYKNEDTKSRLQKTAGFGSITER
jgi:hypothetical protein